MKKYAIGIGGVLAAALLFMVGCEWESSDDYNTSQGGGQNVNMSGIYRPPELGGSSYVVGTNVTRLILTQIGNTVDIRDDLNSHYRGTIGAPGIVSQPYADGTYPAGSTMLQAQLNFSGENQATGDMVTFGGIIRAVAVTDVKTKDTTLDIDEDEYTQSKTTTYSITESDTQYIMEGNWEEDGVVMELSATAPAAGGTFTVTH